jgi:hypothetical protein
MEIIDTRQQDAEQSYGNHRYKTTGCRTLVWKSSMQDNRILNTRMEIIDARQQDAEHSHGNHQYKTTEY